MKMVNSFVMMVLMMTSVSAMAYQATPVNGTIPKMQCVWTEPFMAVTITGSSIYKGEDIFKVGDKVSYNAPLADIDDVNIQAKVLEVSPMNAFVTLKFDLGDWGVRILHVDLNQKGSDGMSDREYAASGTLLNPNNLYSTYLGGCEFIQK